MTTTQSLTERNRAVVEALYNAAIRGDFAEVLDYLDEDLLIHEPPFLPFGGVWRKPEFGGLVEKIGQFMDLSDVQLHYTVADGARVMACLGLPDKTTGERTHYLEQCTLSEGRIVEMRLFYHDPGTMIGKRLAQEESEAP